MIMKYWGFLLLKLAAGALVMRFVWRAILLGFRDQARFARGTADESLHC